MVTGDLKAPLGELLLALCTEFQEGSGIDQASGSKRHNLPVVDTEKSEVIGRSQKN